MVGLAPGQGSMSHLSADELRELPVIVDRKPGVVPESAGDWPPA